MNAALKLIALVVRPSAATAVVLSVSIVAVLGYSPAWLPAEFTSSLSDQSSTVRFTVFIIGGIVMYLSAMIVAIVVLSRIHFAIDPDYAAERQQKRDVKRLKVGDRIRVTDVTHHQCGTIVGVEATGETFEVMWDADGHRNTLGYFDVGMIEALDQRKLPAVS